MSRIEEERIKLFLSELYELSMKYRIGIGGCGCCGSPTLDDLTGSCNLGKIKYTKYEVDDQCDCLRLNEELL